MSLRPGALGVLPFLWCALAAPPAQAVVEVPGPPARPSLARAEALYVRTCQPCHGEFGVPPPQGAPAGTRLPSFGDPDWLRDQTPAAVFEMLRAGHGVRSGGVPAGLGLQEAWDGATFVWSFARSPAQVGEGRRLFAVHCADCHGPAGDGIGAVVEERPATSSDFSLVGTLATDSDAELAATLEDGLPEFGMPAFGPVLNENQRRGLIHFLRALPFAEVYLASASGRRASLRSPHLSRQTDETEAARRTAPAPRRGFPPLVWLALGALAVAGVWWMQRS